MMMVSGNSSVMAICRCPAEEARTMATIEVDFRGLKCPMPVIKLGRVVEAAQPGDFIVASANCPAFEADVTSWCRAKGLNLLSVIDVGDKTKKATIKR
jgi:TusA-related sulfurtransferase